MDAAETRDPGSSPGFEDAVVGAGFEDGFELDYDAETLAALDAWSPRVLGEALVPGDREPARSGPRGWRGLTAGVVLNAMVLGVGEALGDEGAHEALVELRPAVEPDEQQPVTFLMVPGVPRASRVIVRPWLLAS